MQAGRTLKSLAALCCLALLAGCQSPPRPVETAGRPGAPLTQAERDRASALAKYSRGVMHDLNDESAPALTNYLEATQLDPDNEELYFRVTMGLLRDRRYTEALDLMQNLCKRHPKSEKALSWLALSYRAADEEDKALEVYKHASKIAPASSVHYLEMANILAKQGNEIEALDVLSKGIKRAKEPVDLVKFSTDILIRRAASNQAAPGDTRRIKSTIVQLERASVRFPDDASLLHRLGDLYIIQGDLEKAVAYFEKIEKQNPMDLRTRQKLALSFLAMGDKTKAIETLEKLSAKRPNDARIHYYLGELHEQSGEKEKAIACYKKSADCDPPDAAAYLKLSILLVDQDPERAVDLLKRGQTLIPNDPRLAEMLSYIELGRKHYDVALKHFERAERMMNEQKTAPMTPNFRLHHAIATQMSGQTNKASEILQKAMELNPAYLDAYVQYVAHDQDIDHTIQSIGVLTLIAGRLPDNAQLQAYIGFLDSSAKRFPDAVAAFEKCMELAELSDDKNEILTPQLYFSAAAAYERDGQIEKADAMFRKCLKLDPGNAEAYNYIAYMWAERGEKLDEALKFSKKSIEIDPESAAFIDTLGWIYFMKGEYKKSLKEIQRAANQMPEDPTIVEHMGSVMDKLGKPDRALEFWKRAVVLDSENEKLFSKLAGMGVDVDALKAEAVKRKQEQANQKIRRAVDEVTAPQEIDEESTDPATLPAVE